MGGRTGKRTRENERGAMADYPSVVYVGAPVALPHGIPHGNRGLQFSVVSKQYVGPPPFVHPYE